MGLTTSVTIGVYIVVDFRQPCFGPANTILQEIQPCPAQMDEACTPCRGPSYNSSGVSSFISAYHSACVSFKEVKLGN